MKQTQSTTETQETLQRIYGDALDMANKTLAQGDITINITYAPVTHTDNRQLNVIHNGRLPLPLTNRQVQALCTASRRLFTARGQYIPIDADTTIREMMENDAASWAFGQ